MRTSGTVVFSCSFAPTFAPSDAFLVLAFRRRAFALLGPPEFARPGRLPSIFWAASELP
jgi:hypothetical protein